ncbi:MAG: recombination mediator RecR [Gemmatimonadota bacterium]
MSAIEDLVTEFARLPGIGRKTAQRLTYHLLQQTTDRTGTLAAALIQVAERVRSCSRCGDFTEQDPCPTCQDPRRDDAILCVVEEPSAVPVLERAGFRGRYLVLGGRLSPLDGMGPEALRVGLLEQRLTEGLVREVVLATNPSLEGEATATYIQERLTGAGVQVSRLARGLPMGGDLEFVDGVTMSHALRARQTVT